MLKSLNRNHFIVLNYELKSKSPVLLLLHPSTASYISSIWMQTEEGLPGNDRFFIYRDYIDAASDAFSAYLPKGTVQFIKAGMEKTVSARRLLDEGHPRRSFEPKEM